MQPDQPDEQSRDLTHSRHSSPAEVDPHRQLARAGAPAYYLDDDDDAIDLAELWLTIRKYKWTILSFTALVVAATIVATRLMLPVYQSSATIQINPDMPKILEYQDLDAGAPNSLSLRNFHPTQYEILRSRSLADMVIDELDLMRHPELRGEVNQRSLMAGVNQLTGVIASAVAGNSNPEPRQLTPEEERARTIDRFLARLSISPVRDSNLVNVGFESFDPELAALATNTLVNKYIQTNLQRHYDAGNEAREFLREQLVDMQASLERADQSLQDFAKQQGIADLEERVKLANEKLASLEAHLTTVQQDKVSLKVKYDRIQAGHGDSLPEVVNSPLITTLQERLIERRAEYSQLLGQFKPQYPRLIELNNHIEQLESQINAEKRRILDSIVGEYESLVQRETALAESIRNQEGQLLVLNQRSVQYNILRREVETNKELYNGLLQRMKEIGVAAGVRENNVAVIDAAETPLQPYKPNMAFNASMALVLGMFGGTGLAFFLRFLDNTVRRPEDIETLVDLPSLGLIPKGKRGKGKRIGPIPPEELAFYSINQRQSEVSEAYRSLRTSLTFSSPTGMPKTLAVTSPAAGEGKTTTACNLACVLAQSGKRTLLIDADLRRADIHKYFEHPQVPGLTQRIARRDMSRTSCLHDSQVKNLYVLTSGTIPPNPAELLAPERVRALLDELGELFDHIIIDSAPVLGLADALVLSRAVDGVVMVAACGETTKEGLRYATRRLRQVHAPLLGVVLNRVDLESPDYNYYYSGYYHYAVPEDAEALETDDHKRISQGQA